MYNFIMIDKETLKQFENIDFNLVKQYLPTKEQVEKLAFIAKEQYESSISCQS